MKAFAVLLALLALIVLSTGPTTTVAQEAAESRDLKPLPELRITDFTGKAVKPEELAAKAYVIDFWATWCGPCIVEIPALNQLQAKYADKGLRVVGVTLASGEAKEVKPLVDKHKMKYTVLMGDDEQAYDLQIMGFPTTIVVTKDWKIYKRYIGLRAKKIEQIEVDVQNLLDSKP